MISKPCLKTSLCSTNKMLRNAFMVMVTILMVQTLVNLNMTVNRFPHICPKIGWISISHLQFIIHPTLNKALSCRTIKGRQCPPHRCRWSTVLCYQQPLATFKTSLCSKTTKKCSTKTVEFSSMLAATCARKSIDFSKNYLPLKDHMIKRKPQCS